MMKHTIPFKWISLALVLMSGLQGRLAAQTSNASAAPPPDIVSLSKPQAGETQIIFHGAGGPFQVQTRTSLDTNAPWFDVLDGKVIQIQTNVFLASFPMGREDAAFYRILSQGETIAEIKGWAVLLQVSAPANRLYFAPGESPVVTVTILDNSAQGVTRDSFATLSLYLDGPQDPQKTVTAAKLLNASTDRTKTPHHYVDLIKSPLVQINNNVLTYTMQPVTDESPGTYTASLNAVLGADAIQQVMKFVDLQIGTNTVETPIVAKVNCASCHQGAVSGKMYMHHVDPGRSPTGSWALDYEPVRSCKACHNNDGYAAYSDASVAGGKVPDPIVRRVHGVHMGQHLTSDFNTNAVTGDFRDYTHLEFPADARNCTSCHVDDRWKTAPNRLACGSCHDNTWFGAVASIPAGRQDHFGGQQDDDSRCSRCHTPDTVMSDHAVAPVGFKLNVNLALSAPANGKFFGAGETPQVSVKVTDAATGAAINPTNMVDPLISTNVAATEWKRANLFVSGPRADTVPVLTTAAAITSPTASYANNELRFMRDDKKRDPRATRTTDAIVYQLDDVAGLAPGTYTVFADIMPAAFPGGFAYTNFQVGTTNLEPLVAGNCTDCHGDNRMHTTSRAVPFIPDICKSCHDNLHQLTGKTNWNNSEFGFGVAPLSRRVHGVHFGNYVNNPGEIASTDYSHVIFPQDVRNCTKCHSQSTSWKEKPSRLACLACHDSDAAKAHGELMTSNPTPTDPWNPSAVESCIVCHGSDDAMSPDKVHSISNPYVPPYPRAAR